jgi:hypothetical protein
MATPITVSIPHQLGRAEARRRIEAGFAKIIHQLPGSAGTCSERWDGDRLTFGVAAIRLPRARCRRCVRGAGRSAGSRRRYGGGTEGYVHYSASSRSRH